jgi:hypothetical protein
MAAFKPGALPHLDAFAKALDEMTLDDYLHAMKSQARQTAQNLCVFFTNINHGACLPSN